MKLLLPLIQRCQNKQQIWHTSISVRKHLIRSSHQRCSVKNVLSEILQNSEENTCVRVSILIKLQPCNRDPGTQVFSCEFWEISKNTFLAEHLWAILLSVGYSATRKHKKSFKEINRIWKKITKLLHKRKQYWEMSHLFYHIKKY